MVLALNPQHPLEGIPASFTLGPRWHVFYTQTRAEKTAQESIRELGFPVFVPFEKRIQRPRNRKPRLCEVALFPRYGFVQFEINKDRWGEIVTADGVAEIIRMNSIPCSVPDAVIDGLRLAETVGVFDKTKPPAVGVNVEVSEGPFAGLIGKVMRARTGDRMDVLLKFLGGECLVTAKWGTLREV